MTDITPAPTHTASRYGAIAQLSLAIISLLVGAGSLTLIFCLTFRDSTVLPFWDHWAFINVVARNAGHYPLSQLWEQHNEHRILLPRLLMLVDLKFFHGRNNFLLWSILTFQALHSLLFFLVLRALPFNRAMNLFLLGITATLLFSPVQMDNFVWGFQITFILAAFFISLALYLFSKAMRGGVTTQRSSTRRWTFAGSMVAAICAMLSLASGMFVWPILLAAAVILRAGRRLLVVLLAVWIGGTALYFHHYESVVKHGSPLDSLRHPIEMVHYLALYVGGCWVAFGQPFATGIGLLGVVLGIVLLSDGVLRWRSLTWPEVFLLTLTGCVLFTATVTGMGRLKLGVAQGFSSRYQTVAVLLWAATIILTIYRLQRAQRTRLSWAAAILLASVVWSPLTRLHSTIGPYAARAGQWRVAEAAILSGVMDNEMERSLTEDSRKLALPLAFLEERKLSLFSEPLTSQTGSTLSTYYRWSGATCVGAIEGAQLVSDLSHTGLRITGWAWDSRAAEPVRRILITNQANKIIGFGVTDYPSAEAGRVVGAQAAGQAGWFAYRPVQRGDNDFRAYGVLAGGRAVCSIEAKIPPVRRVGYGREVSQALGALSNTVIGVFRNGQWWRDRDRNGTWSPGTDQLTLFGQAGDLPVIGDWDGTGKLRIGVFRNGQWWLDMNGNFKWDPGIDRLSILGQAGDVPIVGDWDGTGKLRIGVFRNGQWWLDMNGNCKWDPGVDRLVILGQAGDIPVVGDWNGTGKLRVGVFRNGQWWLDMNGDLKWDGTNDRVVQFGDKGDSPVIGNWDSVGTLRIGVFRNGHWLLDMDGNYAFNPDVDADVVFGQTGDSTSVLQWPNEPVQKAGL